MNLYLELLDDEADRAKVQWIYDNYKDIMYRVALDKMQNDAWAQDVVQETFFKISSKFEKIRPIPCMEIGGYIVIMVRNTARDIIKRENLRSHEELDEDWQAPEPSSTEGTAEYNHLVSLIRAMPPIYRDVLELKYVCEKTSQEIADTLGISLKAAESRATRGRELLMNKLKREGYASDRI